MSIMYSHFSTVMEVLTLAVSAPLTNDEVEKLKFLLDCEIVERIEACEDIIESIQWTYGLSYLDGIDY